MAPGRTPPKLGLHACNSNDDDTWLTYRISDDYTTRNATGERLPSLEKREGFVYLMESEGEYKIGKAVDIERRRKRLVLELGREIEVLHSITSDDYSQTEWDLHQRFADKRTHGEWFALDPPDIAWIQSQERL
ncbi:MAG: GIY-YIG nuclease family protein [Actinobacteria bacterium]|nr:GIY-YIG nuclease family protein [Actinomycetota bacterium]